MDSGQLIECKVSSYFVTMALHMCRLLGLAPVKIKKDGNGWRISISQTLCFMGNVYMTVLIALALAGLIPDIIVPLKDAVRGRTALRRLTWIALYGAFMINSSLAIYGAPKRMKTLIRCWDRLQKINKSIGKTDTASWRKCIFLVLFVVWFGFTLLADYQIFIYNIISEQRSLIIASLYTCYYLGHVLTFFMKILFMISVLEISSTLYNINEQLELLLQPWPASNQHQNSFIGLLGTACYSNPVNEIIHHISWMYSSIGDSIRQINSSNAFTTTLQLMSCLQQIIALLLLLIRTIPDGKSTIYEIFVQANLCIIQFVGLLIIVEPCYMTHHEMERTSLLVSSLAIKYTEDLVSIELEKLSQHMFLNKAMFSPLGLYTLTRSLIVAIIASGATYTFIIIEFHK